MAMAQVLGGLSDSSIRSLRAGFRGALIAPGDAEYEEARRVWNGAIDRRPGLIARCSCTADVVAAVSLARDHHVTFAVRGGGHSFPGNSVCDGGLVIDLGGMRRIDVDPAARTATAEGGVTWGELDAATQAHGLAVTGGHVTHTGIAGLTTGGGIGHLMRKLGLASDNLLSAEVVLAGGRVVRAAEEENGDLFWAIRGGGGNFGVVTRFEYRLHELAGPLLAALVFYDARQARELIELYRDWADTLPDEITTILTYMCAPPFPFVPPEVVGQPGYAILAICQGSHQAAEEALRPIREFGPPLFEMVAPMPYVQVQQLFDPALPPGTNGYLKSDDRAAYTDACIDTILEQCSRMRPGRSQVLFFQLGGAVGRLPENATAFANRSARYMDAYIAIWDDEAERDELVAWSRGFFEAMRPHCRGTFNPNFTADDEAPDVVARAYGPDKYARLQAVKARYDPENLFRLNQNITPG
jgi:FAD/FMN-containing dehydrogenase